VNCREPGATVAAVLTSLSHAEQALSLFRAIGNRYGEAYTWDSLGFAEHCLGLHTDAITSYTPRRQSSVFASQPASSLPGRTQMSRSCMSSTCLSITSRRYSACW
jgi:hypothetical protein